MYRPWYPNLAHYKHLAIDGPSIAWVDLFLRIVLQENEAGYRKGKGMLLGWVG